MRWVYLRKKTADEPFDLYSDIDSKIAHYRKVSTLRLTFAGMELGAALLNLGIGITVNTPLRTLNLVLGCVLLVMGFVFLGIGLPILKKMRRLKKQRAIREA